MTPVQTVSQMVRADYRTADVFKKWGINYCCGGNLPLDEACAIKGIDAVALKNELVKATKTLRLPNALAFDHWPVTFLVDYIVHVHHAYLKTALPALQQALTSFVPGHLKKYPYLNKVEAAFQTLANELLAQMKAEEESLFPYIKQISHAYEKKEAYGALFVRTLRKPLAETVSKEQARTAALLEELREQTNRYRFTADACTNHQVIYHKLKELDDDLMQHKHLENNLLVPKALEMETSLLQF